MSLFQRYAAFGIISFPDFIPNSIGDHIKKAITSIYFISNTPACEKLTEIIGKR